MSVSIAGIAIAQRTLGFVLGGRLRFGLLKKTLTEIRKLDFSDYLLVVGVGLVYYGIAWFSIPIADIVLGMGLIYWAIRMEITKNGANK